MKKMPHEYRQIVQSTCKWCGKPIEGTKRLKYCKPPKDRTASPCKIAADAKARAGKKDKRPKKLHRATKIYLEP